MSSTPSSRPPQEETAAAKSSRTSAKDLPHDSSSHGKKTTKPIKSKDKNNSHIWSQISTLATKNTTILLKRHFVSTFYTALMLPVFMSVYLGIGQTLTGSGNTYGFTDTDPTTLNVARSFAASLDIAADIAGRDTVVFSNSGFAGGDIDRVIDALETQVQQAGKTSHRISDASSELSRICTVSFQGTTPCYGAVVFNSSPSEGDGNDTWSYTLRGDGVLGRKFDASANDNDAQVYVLPLQRAIDMEIARLSNTNNNTNGNADQGIGSLAQMEEWLYTSQTEQERRDQANRAYQSTFINYMGVAILVGFFGVSYHLPGYVATEREKGLAQLVDAMMFTTAPSSVWKDAPLIRILAHLYSFVAVYLPGWISGAVVLKFMIWKQTSLGVVLPYFILAGLASTSQGLAMGALFKKAQLSGVVGGLAFILQGVLVQAVPEIATAGAVVLGLLFPSSNMVLQIKYMSRAEAEGYPADLLRPPPGSDHGLPSIALWVFLVLQAVIYPFAAAALERQIHGASADSRTVWTGSTSSASSSTTTTSPRPDFAVTVKGLTRTFKPSLFRRIFSFISTPRPATVAVSNLDLSILRGQIIALLGANGSGKSTTLDAIAGLQSFSQGRIIIDASGGGVGVAPQQNVLWDELTVREHVQLFTKLKKPQHQPATKEEEEEEEEELNSLLKAVGLSAKKQAQSSTLSGGQKRKLQLAMMLTGDSQVCCVDEVSSGIDPLSRRKIWDILLAERGRRTIIMTTHFLDEADLLSDKIAIMSKGVLRAEGSAVELKSRLGSGFRVHLERPRDYQHHQPPHVSGVEVRVESDSVVYAAPTSEAAARVVRALEIEGVAYRVSSPTLEDVFLHIAKEYSKHDEFLTSNNTENPHHRLALLPGRPVTAVRQTTILLQKRWALLKTNWIPYAIAFLIPIVAAAVMRTLVRGETPASCAPQQFDLTQSTLSLSEQIRDGTGIVAGPPSSSTAAANSTKTWHASNGAQVPLEVTNATSLAELKTLLEAGRSTIWPGGFWTGSSPSSSSSTIIAGAPTLAYRADTPNPMLTAVVAQNLLSSAILLAVRIAAGYISFDAASAGAGGKTLQLAIYFSIALGIAPAFLSMYVNLERRSGVRGLQYSTGGVSVVSQWASHLLFDAGVVMGVPVIAAALIFCFSASPSGSGVFWMPGLLVPVFLLYITAAIQMGCIISLLLGSQLATWAAVTAVNSVGLAAYFVAFVFVVSLSPPTSAQGDIMVAHYVIAAVFPLGSLMRAMLVSLNVFSQACEGAEFVQSPGAMRAFGGPIVYLVVQNVLYFCLLCANDSRVALGGLFSSPRSKKNTKKKAASQTQDIETATPPPSTPSPSGLQVQHLTKSFSDLKAVDDVSFAIAPGEVYALLGPNGAGKSTTISMIRGDILPSEGGDVTVSSHSILASRAAARRKLGVCPQTDSLDARLTPAQHLTHYSLLRGIPASQIPQQVAALLRAVDLSSPYATQKPAGDLSGGNKRKLSLAIALTGDPEVLLLDEPSSGLDAAAKRVMWDTLRRVGAGAGRAILLTTHSMEETDVLASRAGILAKSMLATGDVAVLRARFGDRLHVHLIAQSAPHASAGEMARLRDDVIGLLPDAVVEDGAGSAGQMRFSIPAAGVPRARGSSAVSEGDEEEQAASASATGRLLLLLEDNKATLGVRDYSVAPTTLNDVFLAIVGEHQVKEEGEEDERARSAKKKGVNWRKIFLGL